jgi:alkylation response protein AidB-like acyl-CoA dehydrogenase
MDLRLPPEDDPRRVEVRAWLTEHPQPTPAELADAGLVAAGFPPPWGRNADPEHRLIIDQELDRAGVDPRAHNPIGIGWAAPTILTAGSDWQRQRFLWPLLRGEEVWCQLFSEPDAGSDLASLTTRAELDGDEWVVNGQKIWTSYADRADYGILLARTDPEAPKHRGISYFLCPIRQQGVEVRPIRQMTGEEGFCQVFLSDARIPASHLVGEVNRGWSLAKLTLSNERLSLSQGGVVWGMGPSTADLVDLARRHGLHDPRLRQRLVQLFIEAEVQQLLGMRLVSQLIAGGPPGPEAAVRKLLADRHGQRVMDLAKDLAGPGGLTSEVGPLGEPVAEWHWGFLFSPALTIGGGTAEVLRTLIGESLLGLPRE